MTTVPLVAVILAGGQSRRMGNTDKATVRLRGRRMIDHVLDRLAPQADLILLSGYDDYGTGLCTVEDLENGPKGPAAGLWATVHWLAAHQPPVSKFMSVPVDAPLLPLNLAARLTGAGGSAIAASDQGPQPTFGLWLIEKIRLSLMEYQHPKGPPLLELARRCGATEVTFPAQSLVNINTPQDLRSLEQDR